jgi:two-component system OmpR family sensor kinase
VKTIRSELTLWYAVALVATVLAFGVTAALVDRRAKYEELDRRLSTEADRAARLMAQAQSTGGRTLEEVSKTAARLRPDLASPLGLVTDYLVVVDSAARIVYGSAETRRLSAAAADSLRLRLFAVRPETEQGSEAEQETFDLVLDTVPVRFVARAVPRPENMRPVIVSVAVGGRTRDLDVSPGRILSSMLFVLPLILLFSAGVGYVLSARALEPLGRMMDELEAITDGRSLHRRLPVAPGAGDEMGRLANTLNAMMARLEASFSALRRFVADASHELKTPLTVMRVGVERALTDPRTAPEALAALDEALQEVRRMTELVDALLTLARVDEGRMELHTEPVNLNALLHEVHETAQMLGEQAGLEVTLDVAQEPVEIRADRSRMRQLLMNLVTNAVKYTAAGGRVWLALTAGTETATISVRDSGIGIAPGDVDRVFDRFWRADAARSRTGVRPGIGLGLSICKWIAEAHGGSIAVTSRPGRGTTFTVTLPREPTSQPAVIES